jgi:serine protease Do
MASRALTVPAGAILVALALLGSHQSAAAQAQPQAAAAAVVTDTTVLPPSEIGIIRVGQLRHGRLEIGDHLMGDGTFADVWYLEGTQGQRVVIELRSRQFDAYLMLLDAAGNRVADDDDSAGRGDARITFTFRATERHQIVVNNFSDEPVQGVYTLQVR